MYVPLCLPDARGPLIESAHLADLEYGNMNMHAMFRSELRPDQPPELGDPRVRRTRRAIAIAAIAAVAAIALFLIFGRDPAPEAAAPSAPPVTVIVPRSAESRVGHVCLRKCR